MSENLHGGGSEDADDDLGAGFITTSRLVRRVEDDVRRVSTADFDRAMRLLGLDPDDRDRVLQSVQIEGGRITATYVTIRPIRKDYL